MSPIIEKLRELLEAQQLEAFLDAYDEYRRTHAGDLTVTALTQRVLPPLLREALLHERLSPAGIVHLYRMIRSGCLILVESDILVDINCRIDQAFAVAEPDLHQPVQPLMTYEDVKPTDVQRSPKVLDDIPPIQAVEVKRVAIVSAFSIGTWSSVDAFDFRKNVCASQQEREFIRAIRQFFPTLQAYPNVPLKNFIDIEKLETVASIQQARKYAWLAQVDVLLCTVDEDPIAGIELDSIHHDSEEVVERDNLKNKLFTLSGLPLIRIRADDTKTVRAEDFYDLLVAETEALEVLRPRRMRPRRTHDFLVPAEVHHRSSSTSKGGLLR